MRGMAIIFLVYKAASRPASAPKTWVAVSMQPPMRSAPCGPAAVSPAA